MLPTLIAVFLKLKPEAWHPLCVCVCVCVSVCVCGEREGGRERERGREGERERERELLGRNLKVLSHTKPQTF